jgi:hypothetical protein
MPSRRVGKAGGVLVLCALAFAAQAAAPPAPLPKGQRDKLDVRDCLEGRLSRLIRKRESWSLNETASQWPGPDACPCGRLLATGCFTPFFSCARLSAWPAVLLVLEVLANALAEGARGG